MDITTTIIPIVLDFLPQVTADKLADYLGVITGVVALASSIAAMTPTAKDDRIMVFLQRILDALALNVGRAKDR